MAQRDIELGKLARQNRDQWSNWDNIVEAYDKKHQIIDPVSHQPITTDSIVEPGQKAQEPAAKPDRAAIEAEMRKRGLLK
jgi:hypothetical protein